MEHNYEFTPEHAVCGPDEIIVNENSLLALLDRIDHLVERAKYYEEHTSALAVLTELRDRTHQIIRAGER